MQKLFLIWLIGHTSIIPSFSQVIESTSEQGKASYDSLWYFHAFSIDLSGGLWIPIGTLSKYYNPSPQFDASMGLIVNNKMRFHLSLGPRVLNATNPIRVTSIDSSAYVKAKIGATIGGGLSYTFYQDRRISAGLLSNLTWEAIDTNIKNPHPKKQKDSLITVGGLGISGGINIWTNVFKRPTLGLRAVYTYSTYNRSRHLTHPIGGHSITVSFIFRVPRRGSENAKWYQL